MAIQSDRSPFSLTPFLKWSSKMSGRPISFVLALILVGVWVVTGLIWGFTDTWLLLINTIATINASLMVFIIQNTQNRENMALHLKIDELIRSVQEAQDEFIAIEEIEEEKLHELKREIKAKRKKK